MPFSVAPAFADSETVSPRWKELVEFYIKNVFANGNLTLRKYDVGSKIPISLSCDGLTLEACDFAKSTFQHSREPSPTFQMELSQKPVIEFVFTTDLQMSTISPKITEDFSDGFSDVSDPQCEMFSKYSANRITRGKLLAVAD